MGCLGNILYFLYSRQFTYIVDACRTVSKDDAIITTILRSWIGLTSIGFNLNYVKKKIIIIRIRIVIIYQPVALALRPTWIRRNATTKRRNIIYQGRRRTSRELTEKVEQRRCERRSGCSNLIGRDKRNLLRFPVRFRENLKVFRNPAMN